MVRDTPLPIFFKILKEGTGSDALSDNDSPIISFEVNEWGKSGAENPLIQDKPKKIYLEYCIPGIRAGMRGMKQGEKRRIFVHPSLGHGDHKPLILYGLIYYDIEVISLNKVTTTASD